MNLCGDSSTKNWINASVSRCVGLLNFASHSLFTRSAIFVRVLPGKMETVSPKQASIGVRVGVRVSG